MYVPPIVTLIALAAHLMYNSFVVTCSFPLYYELKLVGLLWLMTPQTKGAQLIYERFINPFLTQHAAKFDPVFATTKLVRHTIASQPKPIASWA